VEDYFKDDVPWLTDNDAFFRGLEAGAVLMLCRMGLPMIQAKIRWDNEDQVLVAAATMGYTCSVTDRTRKWTSMTIEQRQKAISEASE
jgi:hypothetical protein